MTKLRYNVVQIVCILGLISLDVHFPVLVWNVTGAQLVVQFSCGNDGISMHLEPVFRGFGHLCIAYTTKFSKSIDSEPFCRG